MMNQLIKTRWVKALRSGRYKQTTEYLESEHDGTRHHCCLGVLKRICKLPGRTEREGIRTELLGKAARKIAGITAAQQERLADMNDYQQKTFRQIADYIEEKL